MNITNPARPRTRADLRKLVRAGVRDTEGAARFMGRSVREVMRILARGELWTFKSHGKRLIPVVEMRRWLEADAADCEGIVG